MPQLQDQPDITNREKEILDLLLQGKSNRIIAKELHLSLPTVKQHCSRLYAKFEVCNRTELAVRILGKAQL